MKPTLTPGTPPLREALYALSMAKRMPDAEVLDDIVRQYPQFADELTDFAVELALDCLRETGVEAAEMAVDPRSVSPAVSRAMSRFHNRLYTLRAAATTPTEPAETSKPVDNPFQTLSRQELRALAQGLGVNTVLILKLRDRLIEPESIPESFIRRVSDELKIPIESLVFYLAARAAGASRQFYKADDKPKLDQRQSFSDAVRNSGLPPEAQRRLLSL